MFGTRFRRALGNLFLALLNATLLLILAIVVIGYLLAGRLQDVSETTTIAVKTTLAPQAEKLERIASATENIQSQLKEGQKRLADAREQITAGQAKLAAGPVSDALQDQIASLRSDIADLRSLQKTGEQAGEAPTLSEADAEQLKRIADAAEGIQTQLEQSQAQLAAAREQITEARAKLAEGPVNSKLQEQMMGLAGDIGKIRTGLQTIRDTAPKLLAERIMAIIGEQFPDQDLSSSSSP